MTPYMFKGVTPIDANKYSERKSRYLWHIGFIRKKSTAANFIFSEYLCYRSLDNDTAILTLESATLKSEMVQQPNICLKFDN